MFEGFSSRVEEEKKRFLRCRCCREFDFVAHFRAREGKRNDGRGSWEMTEREKSQKKNGREKRERDTEEYGNCEVFVMTI